jgi:ribulose-phosphate 3-epimerase
MIQKIQRLKEMTDLPIQVDGGINAETAPLVTRAGATVLVAGSAVYKGDPAVEMRKIIEAGQEGQKG